MPFDNTTDTKLKPTLANLSYLLRHKELWPKSFKTWDYSGGPTCAIGLCEAYWGSASILERRADITFGVSTDDHPCMEEVTPEDVADHIDRTLDITLAL